MRRLLLACLLVSIACGDDDTETVETVQPTSVPTAPHVPELVSRERELMGTVFVVQAETNFDLDADEVGQAIDAGFDEMARLEEVLSEWRETSEISRINQNSGGEPVRVSDDAFAVVKAGVQVSRWSGGAFDLSWAVLHGLYDFRPDRQRIATAEELAPKLSLIDWEKIELDENAHTVRLAAGMAIGTGGIGKGYALDRAGHVMRMAGVTSYMLFGGGQVQIHGVRNTAEGTRPWRVGIQHPRDASSYFAFFEAGPGSISTSGDYEHFYVDDEGRRWHHIIDTDTGLPASGTTSVTLLAPEGLYADALSTAVFVLGPERGLQMLASLPFRAEAVILDSECRLFTTPGTRERLAMRVELEDGNRIPGCGR
ncbi:MAG: FAD:protein FMN transferase [Sandaracinus sp.]|nr:FAD:protein FMN transferase [Sandaracinus sp.]MCB9619518.1 FAD:protein FMN transferase [Sandaracinus sp.]MCB9624710.1 FAD:protein FMN transferase [Sandaracinus sp.]MCB9634940.1 FAD:protein FMN transferase [Sandaracinus sp.]